MILSLTCLLISDPLIHSDSEAYQEYMQVRKKAEDNLNKVLLKKLIVVYNSIENLLQFCAQFQGNRKNAVLELFRCLEIVGQPIWTSRKKLWASLIWQIIRQFLHQFKAVVLLKKWNNTIFKNSYVAKYLLF